MPKWWKLSAGAGGGGAGAAAAAKVVRKLGKAKVANMFAHMRKIAQHPLLVRSHFSDKQVVAIAKLAYARLASAKSLVPFVSANRCNIVPLCRCLLMCRWADG